MCYKIYATIGLLFWSTPYSFVGVFPASGGNEIRVVLILLGGGGGGRYSCVADWVIENIIL
jgi:hypothetical protein